MPKFILLLLATDKIKKNLYRYKIFSLSLKILIFILGLSFFAGCDNENSSWTLNSNLKANINLDFKNSKFYGNDGCNEIFGNIKFGEKMLEFADIASTKMACENMNETYEFTQNLSKTRYYELKNNTLLLKDKNQKILLKFTKRKPN